MDTRATETSRKSNGIDLVSIQQAVLVSENASFRRAAKFVGTEQSAVSRRIRRLEEDLGVSLFERFSGGVRMTSAGRRFVERARVVLAELDFAVKSAGAAGRGSEGSLRIGIFSSLASLFLRDVLAAFRVEHPNVEIDIAEGAPRAHITRLRERLQDVAFVTGHPTFEDLDVQGLWHERVYVALGEGHSLVAEHTIPWEALCEEFFIVSRQEPGPEIHDYVIRKLADLGHHPSVTRFDLGRENLMNLVGLGFGISLTSEATIAASFPNVVFRPIAGDDDILPFSAVWSPSNDNPALRRFLSAARALAAKSQS